MNPIKLFGLVAALLGGVFFLSTMGVGEKGLTPQGEERSGGSFDLGALFGGGSISLTGEKPAPELPEQTRWADFYGWEAGYPGMATANDGVAFIHQAVANYPNIKKMQQSRRLPRPASYSLIKPSDRCAPRPLRVNEVLANISTGTGQYVVDFHYFSAWEMAKDTTKWLERAVGPRQDRDPSDLPGGHPVKVVDVVLTDTSGPLYLLLQNRYGNAILWNLIAAEGVEIAHIAMIGHNAAVTPIPGDYDIEFLRAGRDNCVPQVAREPANHWEMFTSPGGQAQDYADKARNAYAAYNAWFQKHFRRFAEDSVVGFDTTPAVLWGPMPAEPIPYRSVQDSHVVAVETDYVFTAEAPERHAFMLETQLALLAEAAGGDLSLIFPEPMTREVAQ